MATDRNEDDLLRMPMWKSYLYHLQQQAPKPKRIVCQREVPNKPPYYGREYHGAISREDADFLLTIGGEGSYLIRESQRAPGQYTLAIRFDGLTKNFKLYYDGQHYVGEKRFDTVQDLVADGLITFYLEAKAADYIAALSSQSNYAESPYVAYNTRKKQQLAAPKRSGARRANTSNKEGSTAGSENVSISGSSAVSGSGSGAATRSETGSGLSSNNSKRSQANLPVEGPRLSHILETRESQRQSLSHEAQRHSQSHEQQRPNLDQSRQSHEQAREQSRGHESPRQSQSQEAQRRSQSHEQASQISDGQWVEERPHRHSGSHESHRLSHDPHRHSGSHEAHRQSQSHERFDNKPASHHHHHRDSQAPPPSNEPNANRTSPQNSQKTSPQNTYQNSSVILQLAQQHQQNQLREAQTQGPAGAGGSIPVNIPQIPEDARLAQAERERVSSSTNTDGPKKVQKSPKHSPMTTLDSSSSSSTPPRSSSPRSQVMDYKKHHNFKMFEEPHFSTPPSSPPPSLHVTEFEKQHNFKVSSVSWCTDFLEVMGCEKPHNFKPHTFKGPHWCDFCANFLWGLIAQGVRCQDCGFNAHKKCSEKVPNDCMPDMKYVKRMFGIDLTTLVKAQNTLIPVVVDMCVKEIEKRGVESEGLYRVAGFHDDVEAIKMTFDKEGELTDITEERYEDINTITSVLKLYFRLLPIPLLTFDIYFKVIDTVRREDLNLDGKLDMLRHTLAQLPPAHYHTLKYLMAHLKKTTEHQQQNMMSAENLAIVFAPTLLRSPETDPLSSLTAVKFERELIEFLILHNSILFD